MLTGLLASATPDDNQGNRRSRATRDIRSKDRLGKCVEDLLLYVSAYVSLCSNKHLVKATQLNVKSSSALDLFCIAVSSCKLQPGRLANVEVESSISMQKTMGLCTRTLTLGVDIYRTRARRRGRCSRSVSDEVSTPASGPRAAGMYRRDSYRQKLRKAGQ